MAVEPGYGMILQLEMVMILSTDEKGQAIVRVYRYDDDNGKRY